MTVSIHEQMACAEDKIGGHLVNSTGVKDFRLFNPFCTWYHTQNTHRPTTPQILIWKTYNFSHKQMIHALLEAIKPKRDAKWIADSTKLYEMELLTSKTSTKWQCFVKQITKNTTQTRTWLDCCCSIDNNQLVNNIWCWAHKINLGWNAISIEHPTRIGFISFHDFFSFWLNVPVRIPLKHPQICRQAVWKSLYCVCHTEYFYDVFGKMLAACRWVAGTYDTWIIRLSKRVKWIV